MLDRSAVTGFRGSSADRLRPHRVHPFADIRRTGLGRRWRRRPRRLVSFPLLVREQRADLVGRAVLDRPCRRPPLCRRDGAIGPDASDRVAPALEHATQRELLPGVELELGGQQPHALVEPRHPSGRNPGLGARGSRRLRHGIRRVVRARHGARRRECRRNRAAGTPGGQRARADGAQESCSFMAAAGGVAQHMRRVGRLSQPPSSAGAPKLRRH